MALTRADVVVTEPQRAVHGTTNGHLAEETISPV
jgi:hypothetical protein